MGYSELGRVRKGGQIMFSFLDYTDKEKREIKLKKDEIKEITEAAADSIRVCLESDSFRKYKDDLSIANKALMEVGIDIKRKVVDPNQRVYLYDSLFTRAEVLGALLKKVEGDEK